ncbi:MADS box transcription factor [Handroanthus impetiginosus]|uniref:MADS box transcription factor n=1 Tax=Handroanthus impetiginosus TaxID=429701 RepID=A0A2G9GRK5_9LAMI|nr:MADS box transcription factor [Handroanthus impetiginosus]
MAKKPSMGRQKIKIEKIEVKNHLQVTFSKRRSGLFKKASELCTLCGVEIAIFVFSPAGKVFSFGHPNVDSIIDMYLTRNPAPNSNDPFNLVKAQRNVTVKELNLQLGQIMNEIELERKRDENLDNLRKTNERQCWWEGPVEKLGLGELEQLRDAMEELKKNVAQQVNKLMNTPPAIFAANGGAVLDQYESKPGQGIVVPGGNGGFGYCHGFF